MGARIREHDWTASPLGPPEAWPGRLKAAVELMLASAQPVYVAWGPTLTSLYNDACARLLGDVHPAALGGPCADVWGEHRRTVEAALAGAPQLVPDRPAPLGGPPDGAASWFAFAWTPLRDEDGAVAGLHCTAVETTGKVLAERALADREARLRFLEGLGAAAQTLTDATGIMKATTRLLGEHLGVAVCAYADMEPDQDGFVIRVGWTVPDARSIVGAYRLTGFGAWAVETLRPGEPLVIRDMRGELEPEQGALFLKLSLEATVCMPLVKEGRLAALMAVHGSRPRGWTDAEIGLVADTTERCWAHIERARSEAASRASEARYRTLFESIESGFCIAEVRLDAPDGRVDYRVVEANPAFHRQTGMPETVLGRWLREAAPALEEHWYETYGRVARTGEPVRFEQGSAALGRWFDVYAFPLNEPEARRVGILFNDISARRNAETALRDLNETLEARVVERTAERDQVWRSSRDLLLIIDAQGRLRAVNPAWTGILGWTEADLIGRSAFEFVHPDDVALTAEALAVPAARPLPMVENRVRHRDGSHRWISWVAAPEGGLIYANGRDVTAEKATQAELAAAQEQLRQSQKMEAVGQLTGGLAHDFNNLLAGVSGSLELMDARIAQGRLAEVERYVGAAQGAARRAAALTHRLLAFSRRQTLDPKPTDVNALVGGMEDLIRHTVGPQVALKCAPDLGVWSVLGDPNQLENALLNLCINARDAMPDGGRLTIETANLRLDERTARA